MTKLFFDFEFTGLHQNTTPVSLGIVSDDGRTFYAEFTDYADKQIDDWFRENVSPRLRFGKLRSTPLIDLDHYDMSGYVTEVREKLEQWLAQFEQVEMWGDCLAYDWVLFCELFGGALGIPKNIYYIPFDLSTLLKVKGLDPDISRQEYSGIGGQHNALQDAKMIRECWGRAATC